MENPYTKEYYQALREGARKSAEAIVPLVMGLLHPRSVIDVGCGDGTWLSVFRQFGAREILGIDREYVTGEILEVPEKEFLSHDLRLPLWMDRKFDLVVSLEVAEHLPGEHAETYVDSLTRLGPAVLFSAAVPYQGGTEHVNEQWPDYWVELFGRKGFVVLDPIRKQIWGHAGIDWWYSQNILMFMKREYLEENPELQAERKDTRESQLSIVHPRMFLGIAVEYSEAFRKCEIFMTDAEKNREEADRQRRTAEYYVAETDKYRDEATTHREMAERFIAEADKYRLEMEAHRANAEHFIAEAEKYRAEANKYHDESAMHLAKAEWYQAEAERYRFQAQPENMSFKEVVKVLPAIILGAIRRVRNDGRKDGSRG
jgi:SAM-dependent methyltransferase